MTVNFRPPLVAEGLTKRYPGSPLPAVRNLHLEVRAGEILTLLGPSGCGKTTTLRLLAGLEHPDAGAIYVQGRLVCGPGVWVPPERRGVGMVFQDYALFPHLTVAENVAFGLRGLSRGERERRVSELLSLVGLRGLARRYPHELSGGQQQRVALARALAPRPAVVLLDEPFSNLDAALRVQMREEVRRILKEYGATAVLVTHDQKDALAISDRIAVMNRGAVEQLGTPQEVYASPRTTFVARFVGQTNLLPGRLSERRPYVVETPLGPVPCADLRGARPGTQCVVSIRPDSLDLDPQGRLLGRVTRIVYGGNVLEVLVESLEPFPGVPLLIHTPPSPVASGLREGQTVRFSLRPDSVSIIEGEAACAAIAGHEGYRVPEAAVPEESELAHSL
ncbi:MAG: ABC transporter ATP-binding protein [Bacillota bacterium]